jgi:hypothetical protein
VAEPDDQHFLVVSHLMAQGEVIPFLGAGANLCDRPHGEAWAKGSFLPSGGELARKLAEQSSYPTTETGDLLRVSQYVDAAFGDKDLYRYLRAVFDADYPPSSLHRFLAALPAFLRGRDAPQPLLITTNYDDLLERALDARGEKYDVVWYAAKAGALGGQFLHRPYKGKTVPIKFPNKYTSLKLPVSERTVILKLHGAVDRANPKGDSYVITEDDYIDYLAAQADVGGQIPIAVRERMADNHFLFLGYSMRDWNLRVILSRLWGGQQLDLTSWSIQLPPDDPVELAIEKKLWGGRGDVEPLYSPLKAYVERLSGAVLGAEAERAAS